MDKLIKRSFDFLVDSFQSDPVFIFHGRKFAVRKAGRRVLRLLSAVHDAEDHRVRLLSLRDQIQSVLDVTPPVLVCYLVSDRIRNKTLLRLLIWILGRSGHRFTAAIILIHHKHGDPKVRRAVVRSLKRLNALVELQVIERECPFADTRLAAAPRVPDEFSKRLDRFTACLCKISAANQPALNVLDDLRESDELVIAEHVEIPSGATPRNEWEIRRFLRRIRIMVGLSTSRRGRLWPFGRPKSDA